MIKTEYGTVDCAKRVSADARVNVECPLTTEVEVKKPVSVSATAYIMSSEDKGETTLVKAKIAFEFVYLAEDGFKKSEAIAETETELNVGGATVFVSAEDARAVNGVDGYVARCTVRFVADGLKKEEKQAVVGGEGLRVKELEIVADDLTGTAADEFVVTDEFELNYSVKEVLARSQTVKLKSVESGVSRIIFEGEVNLCVKTLPMTDNTDILKEKRSIPFRYELACAGALPEMQARGRVSVTRAAYKVFTDEAKGKSSVAVEFSLGVCGEAAGEKRVVVAADAYSLEDETDTINTSVVVYRLAGRGFREERVVGVANATAVEGGRILNTFGEGVTVVSVTETETGVSVAGVIRANVVFRNSDNGVTCVQSETPFSSEIVGDGAITGVCVTLADLNARVRNGAVEFEAELISEWTSCEKREYTYAEDIRVTGERKKNDSTISLILPVAGDDAWDLSKRTGIEEDEILKLNPELEFPLVGNERIIIYRQKT